MVENLFSTGTESADDVLGSGAIIVARRLSPTIEVYGVVTRGSCSSYLPDLTKIVTMLSAVPWSAVCARA